MANSEWTAKKSFLELFFFQNKTDLIKELYTVYFVHRIIFLHVSFKKYALCLKSNFDEAKGGVTSKTWIIVNIKNVKIMTDSFYFNSKREIQSKCRKYL